VVFFQTSKAVKAPNETAQKAVFAFLPQEKEGSTMDQAQENTGGWHLDRRISIGHLITTGTVAVAMVAWMLQLENRVAVHDVKIDQVEKNQTAAKAEVAAQYAELIRRLERIDSRLDR